jgi:hypothetical protein
LTAKRGDGACAVNCFPDCDAACGYFCEGDGACIGQCMPECTPLHRNGGAGGAGGGAGGTGGAPGGAGGAPGGAGGAPVGGTGGGAGGNGGTPANTRPGTCRSRPTQRNDAGVGPGGSGGTGGAGGATGGTGGAANQCDGNFSLGQTPVVGDTIMGDCNGLPPTNCRTGFWIQFPATDECICLVGCGDLDPARQPGQACTNDGAQVCRDIISDNGNNRARACVPDSWNLCTAGGENNNNGGAGGSAPGGAGGGDDCGGSTAECTFDSDCCSDSCSFSECD